MLSYTVKPDDDVCPIITNGYVYPYHDSRVVAEALPSLTCLSISSYHINSDGSLTMIEDEAMINAAHLQHAAPKMVITNMDSNGFNRVLANTILNSPRLQDLLLENVLAIMLGKRYAGLDIDFEYLYPSDREAYNRFLQKASRLLHENNLILSTAIAPKRSADQAGLLYGAHDYEAHGLYADQIILMTYEWGTLYGPPMSIAPINQVKQVLDYAVTVIPSRKILMGIPNYAYDWTLPYRPRIPAKTLTNPEAAELAQTAGTEIQYQEDAQSPYFYYDDADGIQHVVWFENPRSIRAKLLLVNEYHLGGVSYRTVGQSFPQNWLILDELFEIANWNIS